MERLSLSAATSMPTSVFAQSSPHHDFIASRRIPSVRRRRWKKVKSLPRPRASVAMSPALDPTTGETGPKASRAQAIEITSTPDFGRPRRTTAQSDIQDTIQHPGSVRINVQGAFIVDEEQPGTPKSEDYEHDPQDIRLPNHTAVVSHVAVDIGGSLAKLVYFSREPGDDAAGGRLNFFKFETDRIDACIEFMRKLKDDQKQHNDSKSQDLCIMATGGGAFKYHDKITQALDVEVIREDEMECLIIGLDFFINEIPDEVFTYSEDSPMEFVPHPPDPPNIYPYLLVNIGSGVSMIKVSGPRQFERIGGTSLGGGTLWGLLSLLTGARSFDDMLRLAENGDNSSVDLLVGDIYGQAYNKIGLKSTHIASSFGKVYKMKRAAEREAEDGCNGDLKRREEAEHVQGSAELPHTPGSFRPEDMARSLLYAVSNNIGQIAHLHAEKHGLPRIYFGGSFIGGHSQTMNTLSYAIRFWSKDTRQAYFLRHEGYLGAVGAFLKRQPRNWGRRESFAGQARPT